MAANLPEEATIYCARHPQTETVLRCGRCETPICPRCLVQTPVGARCPDCARSKAPPMVQLRAYHYPLAFGAAILAGMTLGYAWWWVLPGRLGLFFAAVVGLGIGWATMKTVDLATSHKRGVPIQIAAAVGVVLAYVIRNALAGAPVVPSGDLSGLIVVAVGILVATTQLRYP